MSNFASIEDLKKHLEERFDSTDKAKVSVIYASNTSGKTRLSKLFCEENTSVLCYNAFLEDLFHWDNESLILKLDKSDIGKLILDEGLDVEIRNNFMNLLGSKIEPNIDISSGNITFNIPMGRLSNSEDNSGSLEAVNKTENIKISKGEESLFIWALFYTILNFVVDTLIEDKSNRSTDIFDNTKYIVIDDPVSSMDDIRIVTIALSLLDVIKKIIDNQDKLENKLKILITTHHTLFFNVMHGKDCGGWKQEDYTLSKLNNEYVLNPQKCGSPFAYHHVLISELKHAITTDSLEKYHFNLFRCLLEKTANFLGYTGHWSIMLDDNDDKKEIVKLLDHYSHGQLSEFESSIIERKDKELFINAFNSFVRKYKWNYDETYTRTISE